MSKVEIDSGIAPFVKPIILVGVMIKDRPNFMNVAWLTRLAFKPNIWAISIGTSKYTVEGIRREGKFSINIPSMDMITETDYCGLVSGRDVDKSRLFNVFYGKLEDVPMIQECPVCVELTVFQIIELHGREIVMGEVQHIYSEERYMTEGVLDQKKINPLLYTNPANQYWALGDFIGDAFSIGKKLKD